MHWMTLEELNIFVIVSYLLFCIIGSFIMNAISHRFNKQESQIKQLEQDLDEVRTELSKYTKK